MAQHHIETIFQAGECYNGLRVDDANELFDLGQGQYIMDWQPNDIFYTPASCGTSCKDESGKVWINCTGYSNKTQKNRGFIIAFIILAVGFAAYWYLNKK